MDDCLDPGNMTSYGVFVRRNSLEESFAEGVKICVWKLFRNH